MEDLKVDNKVECKVYSCLYNQASNCHKGVIFVSERSHLLRKPSTVCGSYRDKGFRTFNIEASDDLSVDKRVFTEVACEVNKCMYNHYNRCDADQVLINSKSEDTTERTHCETYTPDK
jgi:hypothetical protein